MRGGSIGESYKFSQDELIDILRAMDGEPREDDDAVYIAGAINRKVSSNTHGMKYLRILRKKTGYPEAWRFNTTRSILKAKNDYWASK